MLQDGVLYALDSNGTDSWLWRTLSPSTASSTTTWSSQATTAADDVAMTKAPRALKVSTGSIKLWAVGIYDSGGTPVDKIYSLTDTIADTAPELSAPADERLIGVNPVTGRASDISFTWLKPSDNVTAYDLEIAFDDAFTEKASTPGVGSTSSTVAYIVGPFGTTLMEYMPETTYYWRVRVDVAGPMYSPYSEVRSFTTGKAVVPPFTPELKSPAYGVADVSIRPSFIWLEVAEATTYDFELADNAAFRDAVSKVLGENVWTADADLKYSSTYYWRVRAVEGRHEEVSDWVTGVFTTMAAPPPAAPPELYCSPITGLCFDTPEELQAHWEAQQPPAEPVPTTPAYIWAIIIIGAVLVIALIVLIVRTRRVV